MAFVHAVGGNGPAIPPIAAFVAFIDPGATGAGRRRLARDDNNGFGHGQLTTARHLPALSAARVHSTALAHGQRIRLSEIIVHPR